MNNYEWLAMLKANSWSVEVNENACNYCTAKQWIEEYSPDLFTDVPADLIEAMKATNTIVRLQIYPNTPVGFNWWCGPTLDSVVNQARADYANDAEVKP
jgi:hypothetical protein